MGGDDSGGFAFSYRSPLHSGSGPAGREEPSGDEVSGARTGAAADRPPSSDRADATARRSSER